MAYPKYQENELVRVTETYWKMDDGIMLYTRIAVPQGVEKCPIVFQRTPYEKSHIGKEHDIETYAENQFILHGYAVVFQHVRGRGDSQGAMRVYDEREDGLKSLEYIRKLPCYNGEIFLSGGSYTSAVHQSYLDAAGDDEKGAVLGVMGSSKYLRNYRNGSCYDIAFGTWWLGVLDREYPLQDRSRLYERPYKNTMPNVLGVDIPEYTDYLTKPEKDPFWKQYPRDYKPEGYKIPILFMGGWWDWQHSSMLDTWCRMPEETRQKSAYIIGPWGHSYKLPTEMAYIFPEEANRPADFATDFFDSIRESREYKYAEKNKITYWSVGGDRWRSAAYPKKADSTQVLRFGTDLKTDADSSVTYTYDPENCSDVFRWKNIHPAHEIGTAEDVVSFVTEPFAEDTAYNGRHRFHLEVSSDCEDTGFFCRIYTVKNGTAYNLTETVTCLSYFYPDYKPGEKVTLDLQTPLMAFTIKKGAQLRVDIASHSGIYMPPANVKGHWAEVTETKVASNTVYFENSFAELEKE